MTLFNAPNLDGLPPSDLDALARVFAALADYASTKAEAMRDRVAGRIPAALAGERICDRIYQRDIPLAYRW